MCHVSDSIMHACIECCKYTRILKGVCTNMPCKHIEHCPYFAHMQVHYLYVHTHASVNAC